MNTDNDIMRDPLKEFITPDLCEKAPEGFSEKVMEGVILATTREKIVQNKKPVSVPLIACLVTLSLVLAAFLLRGTGNTSALVKMINSSLSLLPEIKTGNLFNQSLPLIISYIALAIAFLGVFDKLLFRFFNRKKQAHSQA